MIQFSEEKEATMRNKLVIFPTSIPQNIYEASTFLTYIEREQRKIDKIQDDLDQQICLLENRKIKEIEMHQEKIQKLVENLFIFAEKNRQELTQNGQQETVKLPNGWFGWGLVPPIVLINNTKDVINKLKYAGLKRFIKIKEEINEKAILKETSLAKTIKGIRIKQYKKFIVKPLKSEEEIVYKIS